MAVVSPEAFDLSRTKWGATCDVCGHTATDKAEEEGALRVTVEMVEKGAWRRKRKALCCCIGCYSQLVLGLSNEAQLWEVLLKADDALGEAET